MVGQVLTLTVPHSGDPSSDARELARAWPRFRRALCRVLQLDLGVPRELLRFPYVRVQEITPSDGGHAHYHLWAFLPFLPKPLVAVLWARALSTPYRAMLPTPEIEKLLGAHKDARSRSLLSKNLVTRRGACGRPLGSVATAIIDIQAGRDVEHELIKYLVKDAVRDPSGKLEFVPADVHGRRSGSAGHCASKRSKPGSTTQTSE